MTKANLIEQVKMLETANSDLDIALDDALGEIKVLKADLDLTRTILREMVEGGEDIVTMDDLEGVEFSEDGELTKDGLKMLIKAGMGSEDVRKLVALGDEIVEWLEKKGIKLDSGGSLDQN